MSTLEEARAKIRERPPFEIQNLHLLKEKRSGATFATAYKGSKSSGSAPGSGGRRFSLRTSRGAVPTARTSPSRSACG